MDTIKSENAGRDIYQRVIPGANLEPDPIVLRLDFHTETCMMHIFEADQVSTKRVSPLDITNALARNLSYSTGILPDNTLWWKNTAKGVEYALWEPPKKRKVALQEHYNKPPRRFTIPLPGLIFLCSPGQTPWVFATKKRPTKKSDSIFKAPLCNLFENGQTCPGSHKFPNDVAKIPDSFFISFFTPTADLDKRSVKHPKNIVKLWEELDGKDQFPMNDLVQHGTIKDLIDG